MEIEHVLIRTQEHGIKKNDILIKQMDITATYMSDGLCILGYFQKFLLINENKKVNQSNRRKLL